MRICLVITELEPGGAERALVHLACGLQDLKHSVSVISLKPFPGPGRRELIERLAKREIATSTLGMQKLFGLVAARKRLRASLGDFQPDLVQAFLHHANILTAMARRPGDPWKLVAGYRVADPGRWRRFLEKRYKKRWCHLTCVSKDVATDVIGRLGVDPCRVTTIPNGVEIPAFRDAQRLSSEQWGLRPGRRMLGYIGRLHPQKGITPLIDHLPQLFESLPGHDLVIAGDGPLHQALQEQVDRHGLGDRVVLLGWSDDIPSLMASLDLLLLPSNWEGMPNVVQEAMAAGIPVVSFAVHGISELLGNSDSPQVAEAGDYRSLCQKAVEIARSPDFSSQLGQRNAISVEQFSIPGMVDRYNRLYEELCGV
ncbi:MAG: glycosyltransferase [Pirellulaceae bacterium]